eukprot:scaffold87801_cov42-Phaeocystis_antarctica.AAC.1
MPADGKRSPLSTLYLVSHTDALYTKSPLGRLHTPAVCDVRWKFSVYDCFARGVSRVRASCTVPRLQVRPLVSNNEDLNSLNSLKR